MVFDDITQLINAQRATAWAEVARRLAHEIKNPLTPIQLSAERLEMKLGDRLPREDAETLRRATGTIVSQVAALKAMVDDFRDYARLPAPVLGPLDLNALVSEVLALYENSRVPVAGRLAARLPQQISQRHRVVNVRADVRVQYQWYSCVMVAHHLLLAPLAVCGPVLLFSAPLHSSSTAWGVGHDCERKRVGLSRGEREIAGVQTPGLHGLGPRPRTTQIRPGDRIGMALGLLSRTRE